MPWKESCRVNERVRFIAALSEGDASFAELCRSFGISRKTGYKWLTRYEQLGPGALLDRPPVPRVPPNQLAPSLADAIVQARKLHPTWGPKKLRALLIKQQPEQVWPAASTIGDHLKRNGLVRPRRRRPCLPRVLRPLGAVDEPNDTWCVDFKGHFALADHSRCHPLTITDLVSRYLLKCEGLAQPREEPVRAQFELAFREFGLPERIRSDNGPPFASQSLGGLSRLSVWWIKLGIEPERIAPGQPQQNGAHERMHRTLKAEATLPPQADLAAQQREFDRFRHEYNDERPHEALGQKTPASRYTSSRRAMPRELQVPEYPDMKTRWINGGRFMWRRQLVKVGSVLEGEPVGLEQVGERRWNLYYARTQLGALVETEKGLAVEKP